jgi:hypothetical protein
MNDDDDVEQTDDDGKVPPVQLCEWQANAVKKGVGTLMDGNGFWLFGTMGCGKTLVALHIAQQAAELLTPAVPVLAPAPPPPFEVGRLPLTPFLVIVIVPKCVELQWIREMGRSGVQSDQICRYAGPKREGHCSEWLDRARRNPRPHFLVTSYETARQSVQRGFTSLFRKWSLVILDEGHVLRNGIEKNDSPEDVGRHQTYQAIDKVIVQPFRPLVVVVTATPIVNHQLDAYTLLRWMNPPSLCKRSWFCRSDKYTEQQYDMLEKHLVPLHQPPLPPIEHTITPIQRSDIERSHAIGAYAALYGATRCLLDAIRRLGTHQSPENRERERKARLVFFMHTTRCRRGELFYPLFVAADALENAGVDQDIDGEGLEDSDDDDDESVGGSETSKETQQGPSRHCVTTAPSGPRKTKTKFRMPETLPPLENCSKIKHAVAYCKSLVQCADPKALIIGYYVSPLRILRAYLERYASEVAVFEHYGGQSAANEVALTAFREAKGAAVMIASRGSFAVGKDVPWVRRMLKMDRDWSAALEDQASGRICRPLAQQVHEWSVVQTQFDDLLAEARANSPCAKPFSFEEWMHRMQQSKRTLAADVLANGSVDVEDGDPKRALVAPLSFMINMIEDALVVSTRKKTVRRDDTTSNGRRHVASLDCGSSSTASSPLKPPVFRLGASQGLSTPTTSSDRACPPKHGQRPPFRPWAHVTRPFERQPPSFTNPRAGVSKGSRHRVAHRLNVRRESLLPARNARVGE